jgi:hypothetical protein
MVKAEVVGALTPSEGWSRPQGFKVRADVCNSCHATTFTSSVVPDIEIGVDYLPKAVQFTEWTNTID